MTAPGDDQADSGSSALEREQELTLVNNTRDLLDADDARAGPHRPRHVRHVRVVRQGDRQGAAAGVPARHAVRGVQAARGASLSGRAPHALGDSSAMSSTPDAVPPRHATESPLTAPRGAPRLRPASRPAPAARVPARRRCCASSRCSPSWCSRSTRPPRRGRSRRSPRASAPTWSATCSGCTLLFNPGAALSIATGHDLGADARRGRGRRRHRPRVAAGSGRAAWAVALGLLLGGALGNLVDRLSCASPGSRAATSSTSSPTATCSSATSPTSRSSARPG